MIMSDSEQKYSEMITKRNIMETEMPMTTGKSNHKIFQTTCIYIDKTTFSFFFFFNTLKSFLFFQNQLFIANVILFLHILKIIEFY
jgi:hypothetical protein